jgi:hypothetical protein
MSDEIAGWIKDMRRETMELKIRVLSASASPDCKITVKKKRKSWIEKIRDYDDVFSRMLAAESMREHYKAVAETALWNSATNGRRLKFSVGHNHIEIIVGNPVTACYFHSEAVDSDFDEDFLAVSILHKTDTYDWKRGVIESLENMIHNWIGNSYGDPAEYFNTLFTTYPELGIQPVVKPVKKTKKVKK